ncbi:MAG: hypothetical protein ABR548_04945 [Actinomycetota bacterium]|nr:hypothetical protein [Actinomycetota bacterium]
MRTRVFALMAVGLTLTGCSSSAPTPKASASSGPRPASTAKLSITAPTNGQSVKGPTVRLAIELEGGRVVPLTTTNIKPDEGHIHVKLDGALQSITAGTSFDLQDVKPGSHVVLVEFVASDHVPFDPRVTAAVTFTST